MLLNYVRSAEACGTGRFCTVALLNAYVDPQQPLKVKEALYRLALLYEQPDQRKGFAWSNSGVQRTALHHL